MEIRTQRLTLVPLELKYLHSTHAYASDQGIVYMAFLPNADIEATERFLRMVEAEWNKEAPGTYEFAILLDGRHIGAVSLALDESRTEGELGWVLHRDFRGRGIVTEAARALVNFGMETLGVHRFIATCDAENVASYKVMERLGMKRVCRRGGRRNKGSDAEREEFLYELRL